MVNKNIKYTILNSSYLYDSESNPKENLKKSCFQTEWTVKLWILSILIIQLYVFTSNKTISDVIYPSATHDNNNVIELSGEENDSKFITPHVMDQMTISSPPTSTLSGKSMQYILLPGTSERSNTAYKSILMNTPNVNEVNDASDDYSMTHYTTTKDAIQTDSTLEGSYNVKDVTTEYVMETNSPVMEAHTDTTTDMISTASSTTNSTPTIITLGDSNMISIAPPSSSSRANNNLLSNHTQKRDATYYINTSQCHIPYINPFTPAARKLFNNPSNSTGCTTDEAIVSASFDEAKSQYILHINYTVAMTFVNHSNEHSIVDDLQCCYRQIERSGSGRKVDSKFTLLPCTNVHQDFLVPLHIQAVIIDCNSKSLGKLLQQDAFAFIQVNKTHGKERKADENLTRKLGVLLVGIDSLSRINLRRTMPQTFNYLVEKKWFEMRGYTKIGENTFPNLMALLTGYDPTNAYSICKPNKQTIDDCNLIWTKFKDHGFKTAYAEDAGSLSTFNYLKWGFKKPPTDHYFRPNMLALEKTMKTSRRASITYCIGRRQAGEYIYDYGWEFATRYQNQSNFGMFWTNSFSHSKFWVMATMDNTVMNYLKALETKGILETSVVIFFSDHGRRWGPLLKLPEGFLEERIPMFFVSLPTWMNREYPNYLKNIKINQKRLVTPYDIHMTLQDLLHLASPAYNVSQAYSCSNAKSIFEEIPENRTCGDACIPEAWCACAVYKVVSHKSDVVKKVTQMIVSEINHYFITKNITQICSNLTIHQISAAKIRNPYKGESNNVLHYQIEFITAPQTNPPTIFAAMVNYNQKLDKIELNVEDIARHSLYENTAKCTDDKEAKKYCICKDSVR